MECAKHSENESLLKQNLKFDYLFRLDVINCIQFFPLSLCDMSLCMYVTWPSRNISLLVITQLAVVHFISCHLKSKTVTLINISNNFLR
jgi:hypothetical protein